MQRSFHFCNIATWFVLPYAAVRLLGLALYWFGLRNDPAHRTALRTYVRRSPSSARS
jgi:hypothetical protein